LLSSGAVTVNGGELALGTTAQTVGALFLSGGAINGGVLTGTSYTVEAGTIGTVLSGALVALTKNDVGTVLLNGSNQYGGGTTLNAGTLLLGSSERLLDSGSVTLNGGVFDLANYSETIGMLTLRGGSVINGSLFASVFNLEVGTVNTVFSGAAKVVKTTGGLVDLLSANTYSGGTEIYDGTLRLGANNRLPVTGALTVFGGALELNSYTQSVGTVRLSNGVISGGTLTGTSYVVEVGTISAVLAGSGVTLTKSEIGSVLLSAVNTYTGTTTVGGGTLSLGVDNALALGTSVVVSGGALALGTTTQSVAALTLNGGLLSGGTLTGTSYAVNAGTISTVLAGGSIVLTKSEGGTVLLTGANTYGGGTVVNAGTLLLGGDERLLASGALTQAGGVFNLGGFTQTLGAVTLNVGTTTSGTLSGASYSVLSGDISANLAGNGALTKTS
ncbi:MAG: hypothetical protein EBR81_16255, partial [Proteobacteria bacterium]|nr:hypothetical protein [Pseudomonadota bacterium]